MDQAIALATIQLLKSATLTVAEIPVALKVLEELGKYANPPKEEPKEE